MLGFGLRWQTGQWEGGSYQPKSTPGTPKLPNEALQITFQLTKTIRGPSKGVGATFERIQKNQDFQKSNGRTISATPYGTFMRPRKWLEML